MAYADIAALLALAGPAELRDQTDRDGNAGAVVEAVAVAALEAATVEIDAILARRFAVPLGPVPGIVTGWCCAIARYRLWLSSSGGPPEFVTAEYRAAVKAAATAADGLLALPGATADTPAATGGGVRARNPSARFGAAALADYLGGR